MKQGNNRYDKMLSICVILVLLITSVSSVVSSNNVNDSDVVSDDMDDVLFSISSKEKEDNDGSSGDDGDAVGLNISDPESFDDETFEKIQDYCNSFKDTDLNESLVSSFTNSYKPRFYADPEAIMNFVENYLNDNPNDTYILQNILQDYEDDPGGFMDFVESYMNDSEESFEVLEGYYSNASNCSDCSLCADCGDCSNISNCTVNCSDCSGCDSCYNSSNNASFMDDWFNESFDSDAEEDLVEINTSSLPVGYHDNPQPFLYDENGNFVMYQSEFEAMNINAESESSAPSDTSDNDFLISGSSFGGTDSSDGGICVLSSGGSGGVIEDSDVSSNTDDASSNDGGTMPVTGDGLHYYIDSTVDVFEFPDMELTDKPGFNSSNKSEMDAVESSLNQKHLENNSFKALENPSIFHTKGSEVMTAFKIKLDIDPPTRGSKGIDYVGEDIYYDVSINYSDANHPEDHYNWQNQWNWDDDIFPYPIANYSWINVSPNSGVLGVYDGTNHYAIPGFNPTITVFVKLNISGLSPGSHLAYIDVKPFLPGTEYDLNSPFRAPPPEDGVFTGGTWFYDTRIPVRITVWPNATESCSPRFSFIGRENVYYTHKTLDGGSSAASVIIDLKDFGLEGNAVDSLYWLHAFDTKCGSCIVDVDPGEWGRIRPEEDHHYVRVILKGSLQNVKMLLHFFPDYENGDVIADDMIVYRFNIKPAGIGHINEAGDSFFKFMTLPEVGGPKVVQRGEVAKFKLISWNPGGGGGGMPIGPLSGLTYGCPKTLWVQFQTLDINPRTFRLPGGGSPFGEYILYYLCFHRGAASLQVASDIPGRMMHTVEIPTYNLEPGLHEIPVGYHWRSPDPICIGGENNQPGEDGGPATSEAPTCFGLAMFIEDAMHLQFYVVDEKNLSTGEVLETGDSDMNRQRCNLDVVSYDDSSGIEVEWNCDPELYFNYSDDVFPRMNSIDSYYSDYMYTSHNDEDVQQDLTRFAGFKNLDTKLVVKDFNLERSGTGCNDFRNVYYNFSRPDNNRWEILRGHYFEDFRRGSHIWPSDAFVTADRSAVFNIYPKISLNGDKALIVPRNDPDFWGLGWPSDPGIGRPLTPGSVNDWCTYAFINDEMVRVDPGFPFDTLKADILDVTEGEWPDYIPPTYWYPPPPCDCRLTCPPRSLVNEIDVLDWDHRRNPRVGSWVDGLEDVAVGSNITLRASIDLASVGDTYTGYAAPLFRAFSKYTYGFPAGMMTSIGDNSIMFPLKLEYALPEGVEYISGSAGVRYARPFKASKMFWTSDLIDFEPSKNDTGDGTNLVWNISPGKMFIESDGDPFISTNFNHADEFLGLLMPEEFNDFIHMSHNIHIYNHCLGYDHLGAQPEDILEFRFNVTVTDSSDDLLVFMSNLSAQIPGWSFSIENLYGPSGILCGSSNADYMLNLIDEFPPDTTLPISSDVVEIKTRDTNSPPVIEEVLYPTNGATDVPVNVDEFSVRVSDPDGDPMSVSFYWASKDFVVNGDTTDEAYKDIHELYYGLGGWIETSQTPFRRALLGECNVDGLCHSYDYGGPASDYINPFDSWYQRNVDCYYDYEWDTKKTMIQTKYNVLSGSVVSIDPRPVVYIKTLSYDLDGCCPPRQQIPDPVIKGLEYNKDYAWYVVVHDSSGNTVSNVLHFKTADSEPKPEFKNDYELCNIVPENPRPNEDITFDLKSSLFDPEGLMRGWKWKVMPKINRPEFDKPGWKEGNVWHLEDYEEEMRSKLENVSWVIAPEDWKQAIPELEYDSFKTGSKCRTSIANCYWYFSGPKGPGCPPQCCFLPGTKVSMSDGSYKNIEDVQVGDFVKSFDEKSQSFVNSKVLSLERPVREGYYNLFYGDNQIIRVTNEHPFYTRKADGLVGWCSIEPDVTNVFYPNLGRIGSLEVGDSIFTEDNTWVVVTGFDYVKENVQTYNLKDINSTHTFFADGLLVHNKEDGTEDADPVDPPNPVNPDDNDGDSGDGDSGDGDSGGGSVCFLEGTSILMPDGSLKNIEDVRLGDSVLSYNEEADEWLSALVTKLYHHTSEEMTTDYYLLINDELCVTPNHPVLVDGDWVFAGDLSVGDRFGGNIIKSIERIYKPVPTYNFEVEPYHTYGVVWGTSNTPSIVHNKQGFGFLYPRGYRACKNSDEWCSGPISIYDWDYELENILRPGRGNFFNTGTVHTIEGLLFDVTLPAILPYYPVFNFTGPGEYKIQIMTYYDKLDDEYLATDFTYWWTGPPYFLGRMEEGHGCYLRNIRHFTINVTGRPYAEFDYVTTNPPNSERVYTNSDVVFDSNSYDLYNDSAWNLYKSGYSPQIEWDLFGGFDNISDDNSDDFHQYLLDKNREFWKPYITGHNWSYRVHDSEDPFVYMGSSQKLFYNWSTPGVYDIQLTVTDNDGFNDSIVETIVVIEKPDGVAGDDYESDEPQENSSDDSQNQNDSSQDESENTDIDDEEPNPDENDIDFDEEESDDSYNESTNFTISILKPTSGKLYLKNKPLCSFPLTLVLGSLDLEVYITTKTDIDIADVRFYVDGIEVENSSYISSQKMYNYCYNERGFSSKNIKIALYNSDEEELASKSIDVFMLNLLKK